MSFENLSIEYVCLGGLVSPDVKHMTTQKHNLSDAQTVLEHLQRIFKFVHEWESIMKESNSPDWADRVMTAFSQSEEIKKSIIDARSLKT